MCGAKLRTSILLLRNLPLPSEDHIPAQLASLVCGAGSAKPTQIKKPNQL